MKILVRAPNWIGDQILALPFYYYLRKAYPKAHIASVCVEWVEPLQFRDLVNEVIVLRRPNQNTFREKFKVLEEGAKTLRQKGVWDLAISLPNSLSAAWLLFRSGCRLRRGYKVEGRGILLNDGQYWDPTSTRHRAQAYVDLLPQKAHPNRSVTEFWGVPPETELDEWEPGEMEEFDPIRSWPLQEGDETLEPPHEPYWVLAPGATAESRRWQMESMIQLARKIASETGWKGVIIGGAKEAVLGSQLASEKELKLLDRTAMCTPAGLWKVFRNAKFTLTNESGLAHLAALCSLREKSLVQVVCGAADPRRTRPLGPGKVQVMVNPVECWPCERNTCSQTGSKYLQCLKGIQPDAVWEEIQRGIQSQT